jgi:hypothetical protein
LAAVSKGISDRIAAGSSTAAVEVDEARPAETSALLSGTAEERSTDLAPPSRDVARLEDVLKISPAPASVSVPPPAVEEATIEVEAEPTAEVTSIAPPSAPNYVAAQELREAFWFEQASAFAAAPAPRQTPEPEAVEVGAVSSALEPEPETEADASGWLTALVLLTLLALVMVLTGRRPRR